MAGPVRGISFRQPDDMRGVYRPRKKSEGHSRDVVPMTLRTGIQKEEDLQLAGKTFNMVDCPKIVPLSEDPVIKNWVLLLGQGAFGSAILGWFLLIISISSAVFSKPNPDFSAIVAGVWGFVGMVVHIAWMISAKAPDQSHLPLKSMYLWWSGNLLGLVLFLTCF